MAAVNLGGELKTHILRNASRPFNDKIMELTQLSVETSQEFYDKFLISPEQLEHVKALPVHWLDLSENTSYCIHVTGKNADGLMFFVGNLNKPSYMMSNWSYAWTPVWKQNADDTPAEKRAYFGTRNSIAVSDQDMHKMPKELQTRFTAIIEVISQREKFIAAIHTIFNSCKTLNQAKLSWPGILQYVTEKSYLERLEKKTAKSNRAPLSLEQDTLNELNVTCITHRMTT